MKEGSVVIAVIPQANGQLKKRPAVVLRELPGYHDFLICGVSSQLHQAVKGFDEIISHSDADFVSSGLQSDSLIRLGHLMAISPKHVEGEIGSISTKRRKRLLKKPPTAGFPPSPEFSLPSFNRLLALRRGAIWRISITILLGWENQRTIRPHGFIRLIR